jgi:hypothetical protein
MAIDSRSPRGTKLGTLLVVLLLLTGCFTADHAYDLTGVNRSPQAVQVVVNGFRRGAFAEVVPACAQLTFGPDAYHPGQVLHIQVLDSQGHTLLTKDATPQPAGNGFPVLLTVPPVAGKGCREIVVVPPRTGTPWVP